MNWMEPTHPLPGTPSRSPVNDRRVCGRLLGLAFLLLSAPMVGCGGPEPIVEYEVARKVPPQLLPEKKAQRMLAAIVRGDGEANWFFKMSGPPDTVEPHAEKFQALVKGLKFEEGLPTWTLPEGWQEQPGSGLRFATLVASAGDPPLETSVTRLDLNEEWEKLVADNINRWREQVGLAPSTEPLAGAQAMSLADDRKAVTLDVTGETSRKASMGGPMTAPMMASGSGGMGPGSGRPGSAGPGSAGPGSVGSAPPASANLKFEKPEGWREGKPGMMRLVAFEAGPSERSVEITVIRAGGDPKPNVQRWLGQIRENATEEELEKAMSAATATKVGEIDATFYRLEGDNDLATYAIIAPEASGSSLFVKMTGPRATADEETERFVQFAASLQMPEGG